MSSETKPTLLRITRELIDGRGLGSVSMRRLGRHAELSRTAIYRHFKNKESLLAAIVVENFETLLMNMTKLETIPADSKEFLVNMLNGYYQFAMENSEHYHLMFNTQWDNETFPEIKEAAYVVYQRTSEYVATALRQSNPTNHTSKEATAIIYAFIHGLVELHLAGHTETEKGLNNPNILIERMIDAIFS